VTDEDNPVTELPNPLRPTESPKDERLYSAGVDEYCKVDCDSQYYILIGFMFIAGKNFNVNHVFFEHFLAQGCLKYSI